MFGLSTDDTEIKDGLYDDATEILNAPTLSEYRLAPSSESVWSSEYRVMLSGVFGIVLAIIPCMRSRIVSWAGEESVDCDPDDTVEAVSESRPLVSGCVKESSNSVSIWLTVEDETLDLDKRCTSDIMSLFFRFITPGQNIQPETSVTNSPFMYRV
ncbi:hypothetical protein OGATHE_005776 [Ogataea polymorpha]|uniref:Uncharacterized protein n=1 Tax=Ogataea polymorpha TaxID=460523 RepID=A0A9P8SYV5_9ASCO|nr:hypothetical protein OGATHE_005776 [Ogataea polymorpha]